MAAMDSYETGVLGMLRRVRNDTHDQCHEQTMKHDLHLRFGLAAPPHRRLDNCVLTQCLIHCSVKVHET